VSRLDFQKETSFGVAKLCSGVPIMTDVSITDTTVDTTNAVVRVTDTIVFVSNTNLFAFHTIHIAAKAKAFVVKAIVFVAITNSFETESIVSAFDTIFSITEKAVGKTPAAVS
jgi:hypothetical protein